jgi:hypothetical protein
VQVRSAAALGVLPGLGVLLSSVGSVVAGPGQPSTSTVTSNVGVSEYCASSEEVAFLTLINDYRRANGRSALAMTQTLGAAAEHHSESMADHDYFRHTLIPQGISYSQNMTNHGYGYNTYRGENIYAGSSKAPSAFNEWKFNRTGYADSFEIQVSNDRQSWSTIGKGTNAPSNTWQTLNRKVTDRYVRFYFRNPHKDARLGFLSEVQGYSYGCPALAYYPRPAR